MEAPGLIVPTNVDNITKDILHDMYNIATQFLHTQYKYTFVKPEGVTEGIDTWDVVIQDKTK